jgi:Txe/YoeB family toxin of Txe-Axe toxin-antitoxin module
MNSSKIFHHTRIGKPEALATNMLNFGPRKIDDEPELIYRL